MALLEALVVAELEADVVVVMVVVVVVVVVVLDVAEVWDSVWTGGWKVSTEYLSIICKLLSVMEYKEKEVLERANTSYG